MSGGGSGNKKRVSGRGQGWEEAGAEFYSESYPTGTDIELEVLQRDPTHLTTLLPSKQSRAATTIRYGTRTTNDRLRTSRRRNSMRSYQSTARRTSTVNQDIHVAMMPDLSENLSNEERTWEEIMQIKAMPLPMFQKKELKAKLQNATYLRLQGLEQFKWQRRKAWKKFKLQWKETYAKIELWRHSLKKIEGHFGTGVVSYFLFVKWLVFLNLLLFVLIFLFIILPSILLKPPTAEYCDILFLNTTECCAENYFNKTYDSKLYVIDFIQGTKWMELTLMFYGIYTNQIYGYSSSNEDIVVEDFKNESSNENGSLVSTDTPSMLESFFQRLTSENNGLVSGIQYDLPLAYILVTVVCFVISLIAIVKSAAKGFKERLVEGEGQFYKYCNLVFGGWDFCIHNEKSANIKHKALFHEIKGCIESEKLDEEIQNRTRDEKTKLFFIRSTVNLIVISILMCSGVFIYFVLDFSVTKLNKDNSQLNGTIFMNENFETLFLQFLPSITIVTLNVFVPIIFKYLISFENYSPVIVIRLTLVRTVFLRLSSLGILLISMSTIILCSIKDDDLCFSATCADQECWETYVGQQLYKLLITDFAIHVFLTFFINFPRAMIAKHFDNNFTKFIGEQEFELPKHVLDIVYSQTICWLGFFYAPILPGLGTIVFFLLFYVKKFACLVNSTPSSIVYRASRSKSLFMFVLLLSFLVSIIPVAYAIAELTPSRSCGPFRGLDTVWSIVVITFKKFPIWIQNILFFFSTAGFAVPVFIFLLLCLYYYYAVSTANKHMVLVLKNQLVLEGHDKQFLLNRLSAFIKQQQELQKKMRNAEIQQQRERDRMNASN